MGMVRTVSRWIGSSASSPSRCLPISTAASPRGSERSWDSSVFTGLTGFSTGWVSLLIFSSITRIALAGENPVGLLMVTETAPTKWRATALGGLVGGYPFGYMLCAAAALVVVPLWGWRSLYFLGIIPALLVLWIRHWHQGKPAIRARDRADAQGGPKKQLDILSPARQYPREMLVASLVYFFYLFTWLGWSAWMPFYLPTEKQLGFQTMGSYLTIWMACAIFAYWFCGWLCDLFGRRWVIPCFAVPGAVLLVFMGYLDRPTSLFWLGLATNFLITGSFGTGLVER